MTPEVIVPPEYAEIAVLRELILANPVEMAWELCKLDCWQKQAEILEAVFTCDMVCVHTGHGIGKTELLATLCILWMLSHPDSWVVVTAADWVGVEQIFSILQHRVALLPPTLGLPEVHATFWTILPQWRCQGFSPTKPEAMSGKHSHGEGLGATLTIVDEASGLDRRIYAACMGNMTDPGDHILLVGNPIHADGPFVDAIRNETISRRKEHDEERWKVIHVSSLDSPNFPESPYYAGENGLVPGLASPTWLRRMLPEWPVGTPEYGARILGEIPDQAENTLISLSEYRSCDMRPLVAWEADGELRLGLDTARSLAGDRTCYTLRGDTTLHKHLSFRGWDEPKILAKVFDLVREFWVEGEPSSRIKDLYLDASNMGAGIADQLEKNNWTIVRQEADGTQYTDRINPHPRLHRCMSAYRAHDANRFGNQRAASYWGMKLSMAWLAIPPDYMQAFLEITEIQYRYNSKQQMFMEYKDVFKKRRGKSPDASDSLALTFVTEVGNLAFPMLRNCHKMELEPEVRIVPGPDAEPVLHLKGTGDVANRKGTLFRAAWFSRKGESGCLWAFIDEEWILNDEVIEGGFCTIFDAIVAENAPVRTFWQQIRDKSEGHEYGMSIFSAPGDPQKDSEHHEIDEIWDLSAETCRVIEANQITGAKGLAIIDNRLLTTLAHVAPEDAYWGENANAEQYQDDWKGLAIGPQIVFDHLAQARVEEKAWEGEAMAPESQSLVGDGSSLVKCMRLLAVGGAL